ncbi:hypothetical protein O0I10_002432 [Lichtheimia ornata]|uniref:RING-type E3 ubiquitin transferase n=1 Tax=Lichtheimia ornata TaxID=688661 RepID=A0AAD7Y0L0_9FUNG|nr:uncharacterized protein O0I10_002432 [Lichtheimia ornata]KAJ8661625.1 hypothetical protein O0I10_002432 [Lichtheimia ornata]
MKRSTHPLFYCTAAIFLLLASSAPHASATVVVLSTNQTFADRASAFGPSLGIHQGKLGFLVEPQWDPTGCQVVNAPCEDWVALLRRGGCSFATKVRNMQQSGAVAVAIGDPDTSGWVTMYAPGDTSDIFIPSMFLAQQEYQALHNLATLSDTPLMVLLLQMDDWMAWPMMHLVILIFISPSIVMLFLYISYKIRQRKKLMQDLAPMHVVAKLRIKQFLKEKMGENDAEECAICLEEYTDGEELRVLPCHHMFHACCVDAWLTTQKKYCPICKRDITASISPTTTSKSSSLQQHHILPLFLESFTISSVERQTS